MLSLVMTTIPRAKAASLAKAAVEGRSAACGSIFQVRSIYSWKGALRDEPEALIILKTTKEKVPQLRAFLEKEQAYETDEIIEVVVGGVGALYLFLGLSNLVLSRKAFAVYSRYLFRGFYGV